MHELLTLTSICVLVYMTCWYAASVLLHDVSIVDIAWGIGFIFICIVCIAVTGTHAPLLLLSSVITVWGLRLAGHIVARKRKNPAEDFRYAAWRRDWGKHFWWRSYLQIFLLQGAIMILIALPVLWVAYAGRSSIGFYEVLGTLVWVAGFVCESVADWQLKNFKKSPNSKGKLMTKGLWKYSRHPNYFGEAVQWWGVWIIALSTPASWWTVVSPLLITFLLRYVSGVPMLEKKYEGRKDFEEYKKRTPVFVPWF